MSERTRTEKQAQAQAEWMLQGDEVPIGWRNHLAFELYRLRQWWDNQPAWFIITRNVLGAAIVCLLFLYISIMVGEITADTVYP